MTLLEQYKTRLAVADKVYSNTHNGARLDNTRKVITAKCLQNIDKFMTEALDNSVGVQRSDLGLYKKFALNLTNIALPTLVAPDLVYTYPMSSMSGYVTYLNFTYGSDKGNAKRGDVINNPFGLGDVDTNYTSSKVKITGEVATGTTLGTIAAKWSPIAEGSILVTATASGTTTYYFDKQDTDGTWKLFSSTTAPVRTEVVSANGNVEVATEYPADATAAGTIKYGTVRDATYDAAKTPAGITFTTALAAGTVYACEFVYNNQYIPQNDVPLLNAEMKAIALVAKVRRIAIYYSQLAAFQSKQDYGFDMQNELAQKATGELNYEIDTEVVQLLDTTAGAALPKLQFSKTAPVGVSKQEHYAAFSEFVEIAKQEIYARTKRFIPNYLVIASDILPILSFVPGFTYAPATNINGPYLAGTFAGLKIYVSPALEEGRWLAGVNDNDAAASVAVYAPYLPIVPTQLLGYADGGNSQGFSCAYALEVLNKALIVAGKVVA